MYREDDDVSREEEERRGRKRLFEGVRRVRRRRGVCLCAGEEEDRSNVSVTSLAKTHMGSTDCLYPAYLVGLATVYGVIAVGENSEFSFFQPYDCTFRKLSMNVRKE